MVRALLDGSKTQTRRIVKGLGSKLGDDFTTELKNGEIVPTVSLCPYGQPGDHLWVRETHAFSVIDPEGGSVQDEPENWDVIYRADGEGPNWTDGEGKQIKPPWKPSIHMPRWASRITLEIVSVRVERLQSISEVDAKAEGTTPRESKRDGMPPVILDYIGGYRDLWNTINGPDAWEKNPFVWVVEFKAAPPAGVKG